MYISCDSKLSRYTAIAVAVVAGITLILRVVLATQEHTSVLSGISYLSQFFTILTNFLVLITMVLIGIGYRLRKGILYSLVVAIVCVGIVYHTLLAHLWSPQGLAMLADQGVHTVVPLLTFLWWVVFTEMNGTSWKVAFKATVWPLVYVGFALLRAQFSGFYPYPFLNLEELGTMQLVYNIVGLTIVFFIIGLLLLSFTRLCSYLKLSKDG